jgi:hypothetical protein
LAWYDSFQRLSLAAHLHNFDASKLKTVIHARQDDGRAAASAWLGTIRSGTYHERPISTILMPAS